MKHARKEALTRLSEAGHRITEARQQIIAFLDRARQPKSVQEIVGNIDADETSVYRSIVLFQRLDIVEEIHGADGLHRYALAHGHHHHVVCEGCGYVEHLVCDNREPALPARSVRSRFRTIMRHEVTYFGRCVRCEAGALQ